LELPAEGRLIGFVFPPIKTGHFAIIPSMQYGYVCPGACQIGFVLRIPFVSDFELGASNFRPKAGRLASFFHFPLFRISSLVLRISGRSPATGFVFSNCVNRRDHRARLLDSEFCRHPFLNSQFKILTSLPRYYTILLFNNQTKCVKKGKNNRRLTQIIADIPFANPRPRPKVSPRESVVEGEH